MQKCLLTFAVLVLAMGVSHAASNPFVGTWKTNPAQSNYVELNDSLIITSPAEGELRWEYPSIQFEMQGKPDGSEMKLSYPHKPDGLAESVIMLTARKLRYEVRINGTLVEHGTDEISADGQTMTAVSEVVGKESAKRVEVFHRQ
ncbi:MAG: hypothetical protein WAM65_17815 [Candidatus Korobacteraceae bacterium]